MSTLPPPLPRADTMASPAPRGWWQRHWKWVLPVLVAGMIVLLVAFVALFVFALRGSMMGSDVYRDAMVRASAHPELSATLGEPIAAGFMPMGSISRSSEDGGSGRADLVIGLSGPRSEGHLVATAERKLGAWIWESLVFVPDGGGADDAILIADAGDPVERHDAPAP